MKPNPGHCPPEAEGKRVRVVLWCDSGKANPPTYDWPADGRGGARWSVDNDPFDIALYEVIG